MQTDAAANLTTAGQCAAAFVCGYEALSDYILDERPSPEAIVGMFE